MKCVSNHIQLGYVANRTGGRGKNNVIEKGELLKITHAQKQTWEVRDL